MPILYYLWNLLSMGKMKLFYFEKCLTNNAVCGIDFHRKCKKRDGFRLRLEAVLTAFVTPL